MRSMTGYGQASGACPKGIEFKIEIRTYNRKQFDIKFSQPSELFYFEQTLRRIASEKISRGSVNIKVQMNFSGDILTETVNINQKLAETYLVKAYEVKQNLDIPGDLRIGDILRMPNVINTVEPDIINDDVEATLKSVFISAFDNLNNSRANEGKFLAEDLLNRVTMMEKVLNDVVPMAEKLPEVYREKLYKKIENENFDLGDNDERLLRELLIFSDKCDVSEEITRLKSHFYQFKNYINSERTAVGRSLDFLTQEIQREINTLGVKASNPEISKLIVELKTETEKIREQVQNIE